MSDILLHILSGGLQYFYGYGLAHDTRVILRNLIYLNQV